MSVHFHHIPGLDQIAAIPGNSKKSGHSAVKHYSQEELIEFAKSRSLEVSNNKDRIKVSNKVNNVMNCNVDHGSAIERFNKLIKGKNESGCMEWIGPVTSSGMGRFWNGFANVKPQKFAYTHSVGTISEGYDVVSVCENILCVNYEHLKVLTKAECKKVASKWQKSRGRKKKGDLPIGITYRDNGLVANIYCPIRKRSIYLGRRSEVTPENIQELSELYKSVKIMMEAKQLAESEELLRGTGKINVDIHKG